MRKLSVIMPVFNEENLVVKSIRRVLAVKIRGLSLELLVVNDGSTDKTFTKLKMIKDRRVVVLSHGVNRGKGAAIITALRKMTGEIAVIQDADMEYDPKDIKLLLRPILDGRADVVFGSRFIGPGPHRVMYFWHYVANKIITFIGDAFTNLNLTDIETGYKAFTKEVAKKIKLKESRFSFDPEFTVKVARANFRVYEVGISYAGRSYAEGKKINWKDGLMAIWTIVKYSLFK